MLQRYPNTPSFITYPQIRIIWFCPVCANLPRLENPQAKSLGICLDLNTFSFRPSGYEKNTYRQFHQTT